MSKRNFKGKEYYKDKNVVQEYDKKRFGSKGGKYIRKTESNVYLKLLGNIKNKKILDVATGTGRHAIDMAESGADVTGIDVSKKMLNIARKKAEQRNLEIEFRKEDATNLDIEDNEYDIVTSSRFLHLPEKRKPYLKEMVRVTKDKIVCDFFSSKSLRILYTWALPMNSSLTNPSKMKTIFQDLGLKNIKEERRFFIPYGAIRNKSGPFTKLLINLDKKLSQNPTYKKYNSVIYLSGEKK